MWSNLQFADFRDNGFEGSIPASIFDIPNIAILYFSNNNLDGPIPPNFGSPPFLRDLFLSGNRLSGTVPDIQPGQLADLTELLLEGNMLEGTMPASVCQLRVDGVGILEDLWADCSATADPRIECELDTCCTRCFPE